MSGLRPRDIATPWQSAEQFKMHTEPTTFSAETYFATQSPPPTLERDVQNVRTFIQRQAEEGRRVVLVTSGGTTVPLELSVVRFLDNFSAGTRGATSAEYFLKAGYAVIFMHRQFSLQPFSRHYSHSTNPFLDFLDIEPNPSSSNVSADHHNNITSDQDLDSSSSNVRISVTPNKRQDLLRVLSSYKRVQALELLHTITFVTVDDYLWLLRALSQELAILKRESMFYLAAAVSDFFLPRQKMPEHKIQSGKGSLLIEMDQVPKFLKALVNEWNPGGYIVSFKLETDSSLLLPKARQSLERYGHQVVIGNMLHTRKYEVVFVSRKSRRQSPGTSAPGVVQEEGSSNDAFEEKWLRIKIPDEDPVPGFPVKEIEEDIVDELVRRHTEWIRLHDQGRKG